MYIYIYIHVYVYVYLYIYVYMYIYICEKHLCKTKLGFVGIWLRDTLS